MSDGIDKSPFSERPWIKDPSSPLDVFPGSEIPDVREHMWRDRLYYYYDVSPEFRDIADRIPITDTRFQWMLDKDAQAMFSPPAPGLPKGGMIIARPGSGPEIIMHELVHGYQYAPGHEDLASDFNNQIAIARRNVESKYGVEEEGYPGYFGDYDYDSATLQNDPEWVSSRLAIGRGINNNQFHEYLQNKYASVFGGKPEDYSLETMAFMLSGQAAMPNYGYFSSAEAQPYMELSEDLYPIIAPLFNTIGTVRSVNLKR